MYNNYYNPYMYNPNQFIPRYIKRPSLFNGIFHKFKFNDFLNGASKTLNVVNQAIPIYNQVKPMINNAKTMFRVMKEIKKPDNIKTSANKVKNISNYNGDGNPTFFI